MDAMELKDFCRKYPLEEKLFIVPRRTIGMQMINNMARNGNPCLNLRAVTLQRLAFEILEDEIIKDGLLIIDRILGNHIIIDILKDLDKENPDSYFKDNLIDSSTGQEMYKVIMELKYAGLREFPQFKDLDKIYSNYEKRLRELNGLDYPDIIKRASKSNNIKAYQEKPIGLAGNIEFHNLEEVFFNKLTGETGKRIIMPVKAMGNEPKNYYYKGQGLENIYDKKKIGFFQGYGSRDEIRYVIEDIKKRSLSLDQVVIAYTHSKYSKLINMECEREGLAVSFGQGLGIEDSSVFRFIDIISNWTKNYYNVNEIKPIFVNGDIILEEFSNLSLYEELVNCEILSLKENYNRVLRMDEETDDYIQNNKRLSEEEKDKRIWLKGFFKDLFHIVPDQEEIDTNSYILNLKIFLTRYVKITHKQDGAARQVVFQILDRIRELDMRLTGNEYFDLIVSYIKDARIVRSQPQPGHLFATDFVNAAYSGRKKLYLIGLDRGCLSNKLLESPILLDVMKSNISKSLTMAGDSYEYKKYKIRELLTGDFQEISIGYSNFDTVDIKAKSPSQIYTELKEEIGGGKIEARGEGGRKLLARDLVQSATGLEVLAQCTRKFYFKYCMGLRPREDLDIRLDRWLDPIDKGNIVHQVIGNYLDLPAEEEKDEKLSELVEEACIEMLKEKAYILREVYLREKEELLGICRKIIEKTEKDKEWFVLANELSFGRNKINRIFGQLPSQVINIGGLDLEVSGSIDRIDINREDRNLIRIVDYKIGNMDNFSKKLRLSTGRGKNAVHDYSQTEKLQYYIYKKVLEGILATRPDLFTNPRVGNFLYIFEGHQKNGTIDLEFEDEFVAIIEERISTLLDTELLEAQDQVVYDGENALLCKYCDYGGICMVDKDLSLGGGGYYD